MTTQKLSFDTEELLKVAHRHSPDGITILRPVRNETGNIIDFIWLYENEAIARINGTNPDKIVGKRLLELFPGHAGTTFWNNYVKVAETGETCIFEEAYEGESITSLTWFRICVTSTGPDITILAHDITEQKRLEKHLKEANKRFTVVLDELDALVYVADMDTYELLYINEYTRNLLGDITGQVCWQSLQVDQNGPCDFCTNERLLDENGKPKPPYIWEFQNTKTDVWFECRDKAIPWIDGRLVRMEIATDITARKTIEAELSMVNQAIENSLNAFDIVSEDGKFIYVNKAYVDMWGYDTREEIIATSPFAHCADPETPGHIIGELKRSGQCTLEFRGKRKDGSEFDVLMHAWLDHDVSGREIYPSTSIDMTEYNRTLSDLEESEDRLRSALKTANQANRAKSEFLASMSHELRTPLNAIIGFSQLLQLDSQNPLTPQQNKHIDSILEGGNHLLSLVNEILDLEQIEADRVSISPEAVDTNEIVAECINLVSPLGELRSIQIVDQFSVSHFEHLFTDKMRLKQCLINLLSNAIKFNKDGGSVTIDGHETGDGYLRISVTDTGEGIADDDCTSVFHLFHRLTSDAMIAKEGTGIGLAVTKLLIERMAGQVGFESTIGTGSTFWIELPLISNDDIMIWTDAVQIGVDAIDKDHQVLINLLNRLMRVEADVKGTKLIIDEVIDYTHYHFRREETIMDVCAYVGIDNHRLIHQNLTAEIKKHADTWRSNPNEDNLKAFRQFMRNWLFDHILVQDTKIKFVCQGHADQIRHALEDLV